MAHLLSPGSRSPLPNDLDHAALAQARIELAACLREAARLGFSEGICNHFSLMAPGRNDLFLVNPLGLAFEEVTATSLLLCTIDGAIVQGEGEPEATAFFIHARIHAAHARARAVFHTHMPSATALAMRDLPENELPLAFAGQTALKFWGRVALDRNYQGLALDTTEGDRLAGACGQADIVFLQNHGVLVLGASAAEAWDDLYYLERAAEVQLRAETGGARLARIDPATASRTASQMREGDSESARLHLASVLRRLSRTDPGFDG